VPFRGFPHAEREVALKQQTFSAFCHFFFHLLRNSGVLPATAVAARAHRGGELYESTGKIVKINKHHNYHDFTDKY
jgi:hypothetical protein